MPARMLSGLGVGWQPLPTGYGANEQIVVEVINNSGDFLYNGDVMTWDNGGALATPTTRTVNAGFTGTLATQTITASGSTSTYAASGALIIPATVTGTAAAGTLVPVFVSYTGITGSTFTGAKFHTASSTTGVPTGANIYQYNTTTAMSGLTGLPSNFNYVQPVRGLPAAPGDGGRYVTLSITGAVADPLVCGTVTTDAAASTTTGDGGVSSIVNYPNMSVAPGQPFMMAVAGVARARVNTTMAALALACTDVTPGYAQSGTAGTLGNLLGINLEADTGKDANNTIRVALKIG